MNKKVEPITYTEDPEGFKMLMKEHSKRMGEWCGEKKKPKDYIFTHKVKKPKKCKITLGLGHRMKITEGELECQSCNIRPSDYTLRFGENKQPIHLCCFCIDYLKYKIAKFDVELLYEQGVSSDKDWEKYIKDFSKKRREKINIEKSK